LVRDLEAHTGEIRSVGLRHTLKECIISVIKQFCDSWCVLVTISISLTPSEEDLKSISICPCTETWPGWSTVWQYWQYDHRENVFQ